MKKHIIFFALLTLSAHSLRATVRSWYPHESGVIDELTQEDRDFLANTECCAKFEAISKRYYFKSGPLKLAIKKINIYDKETSSGIFSTTYKKWVALSIENNLEVTELYAYTVYHPLPILTALSAVGAAGAFTWKYMQQAKKASEDNA